MLTDQTVAIIGTIGTLISVGAVGYGLSEKLTKIEERQRELIRGHFNIHHDVRLLSEEVDVNETSKPKFCDVCEAYERNE